MKLKIILAVFMSGMLLLGCSSSKEVSENTEMESNLPNWYMNPPSSDSEYMYAIGEATSSRRRIARTSAMNNGDAAIAQKIQAEVSTMQKNFSEETTAGEDSNYRQVFTDVSKSVAQQKLSGVEVHKSHFTKTDSGNKYEVILLMRMPIGEAANALDEALQNTLSRDEELYTKFKASKAFEDMKKSIEDMENGNMPSEN
ncbi:LPP20 family lipoprotein [Fodinibius saliphilus]|uniref:LPP20 family lipoprotein n=1 Tax=Fodinibius saliphilus TaxID=1920650 RepID=UPI0011088543|nr:LPP20 family lipoprotein [Fodinibius saliphilus]